MILLKHNIIINVQEEKERERERVKICERVHNWRRRQSVLFAADADIAISYFTQKFIQRDY